MPLFQFWACTLPQFLASIRFRAIYCNHFLRNEDAVKKMLFANTRNTTTCQKLWQGASPQASLWAPSFAFPTFRIAFRKFIRCSAVSSLLAEKPSHPVSLQ